MKYSTGKVLIPIFGMLMVSGWVNGQDSELCACVATCSLTGDPHLTSFYGDTAKLTNEKNISMYEETGFAVVAQTFSSGDEYVGTVYFGDEATYDVSNCKSTSTEWTNSKELTNDLSSVLNITVQCAKVSGQFHLDTTLTKTDSGSAADFDNMERDLSVTGACTDGESTSSSTMYGSCECSALCTITGDPHVTAFNGQQVTETTSNEIYYQLGDFQIVGVVGGDTRITEFKFGSISHESSECNAVTNKKLYTFGVYTEDFGSSSVTLTAQCHLVSNTYFWNLSISKTDKADATTDTFSTLEKSLGSTGLCLNP